jgi:prephenate dehydrogenase
MNEEALRKKILALADKLRAEGGSIEDFVNLINQNPDMARTILQDNEKSLTATRH